MMTTEEQEQQQDALQPAAPAAAAAAAPIDFDTLLGAVRPPEHTLPARAARMTVSEAMVLPPSASLAAAASASHSAAGGAATGGGSSMGGKSGKKAPRDRSRSFDVTAGGGGKGTTTAGGGGKGTTTVGAAAGPAGGAGRDGTTGKKRDKQEGSDDTSNDDCSSTMQHRRRQQQHTDNDDNDDDGTSMDRSVQTVYAVDEEGNWTLTRVRPIVVRDEAGFEVECGFEEVLPEEDQEQEAPKQEEEPETNEEDRVQRGEAGDKKKEKEENQDLHVTVDTMEVDGEASSKKKAPSADTQAGAPDAASTSASSSSDNNDDARDNSNEDYDDDSASDSCDEESALHDQLPLESLPGRPTISFRRAEADGRLAALLKSRSATAEDIVRGLARSTREYGRHYPSASAPAPAPASSPGGGEGSKEDAANKDGSVPAVANEAKSSQLLSSSSDLASMIIRGGGSSDEIELTRLLRLEKKRLAMERPGTRSYLPPDLHEVELGDWESQIDWVGVRDAATGDDEGTRGTAVTDAGVSDALKTDKSLSGSKSSTPLPSSPSGSVASRAFLPVRRRRAKPIDPQSLLSTPYNPELDALDFSSSVSWLGADAPPGHNTALARSVPLLLERSVAGRSVALPAAAPPVRPLPFGSTAVFESRYEREMSSVATSTATSLGSSFRPDGDKLEAIIKAKETRRQKLATKKSHRIMEAMGTLGLSGRGRTITSSLMGPGGTERTGRVSRGAAGGTSAHDAEYVEQLDIVYNHSLLKADFSKVHLRQYHRPRLPRALVRKEGPWQFQTKVQAAKFGKSLGRVAAADGSTVLGSYQSVLGGKSGGIRSEADLSPSEGELAIVEYCEERPILQLLKGHTARIVNYYRGDKARCPISAGGGDRPARKRHHGDKASADDPNDAGASGKIEKPPRLKGPNQAGKALPSAADLIGVSKKRKKKDASASSSSTLAAAATSTGDNTERSRESSKITILPDGVTEILHAKLHGPFIGAVEEGTTQTGLVTNLFAAPMFRHESEPTDFLMILGKKPNLKHGKEGEGPRALGVFLRPFPTNIYTVGQVEPRIKVFQPSSNQEKSFTTPFITFQIAKAIELSEQHNDGEGLSLDEISALFESNPIPSNALRVRIKQVATYDRESAHYTTKALGFEDYPGVEGLGRRFTPEGVAAYESSCSASMRLSDLGLDTLHKGSSSVASVGAAMVFLTSKLNAARERKSKMAKNLQYARTSKSKSKAKQIALYEKAANNLDEEWKEIKRRHEVARFIYEELQLAPWHLSGEFIDVHKREQGTGMMKLTGLGDPSGRGEGYSFLREADAKPNKGTGNTDGALSAQIKKITGTENDLRKLTMKQMASLLRSYGMGQNKIDTLKRWDRVHVIRDLSTKAASDGMADGLERYARGEKMKLRDQKRMYHERIQEIWRRQRAALSTDAGGSFDIGRSGGENAEAGEGEEGKDNATIDKNLEEMKDADDSDSEDDEDFAAAFEEELMDVKKTSELVTAQIRGSGSDGAFRAMGGQHREDRQDLSKDAREFAALKRQMQDEREAQGLLGAANKDSPLKGGPDLSSIVGRKVIRRRVTKTHTDGSQTTTFKFIVLPTEVEKVLEARKAAQEKTKTEKKKRRSRNRAEAAKYEDDGSQSIAGHNLFEDDAEDDHHGGGIKIQVQGRTTTKTKKAAGSSPSKGMPSYGKSTKMSLDGKSLGKGSGDKRKKKRKRELEEADLYATASQRMGTSNRRERGSARERMPHVIFADRLENIRATVEQRPGSGPFHRPVNRRAIPRYYEVISKPIDLQEIGNKVSKYAYKTADAFVADFELMKNNAIKFNGSGTNLGNEATAIYDYVKKEVADNRAVFDGMEEAVEDQMNGSRKRKKKGNKVSSSKSKTAGTDTGRTSKTAEIVLDGIKTTVDLGDISTADFNFDGDSDSEDSVVAGEF